MASYFDQISTEGSSVGPPTGPAPTDSFAWKDSALDRELRAIKDKKFSDAPEPKSGRDGANDGLDKSLDRWANTPLPKVDCIFQLCLFCFHLTIVS